jgi:hypothetical protein
MTAFAERALRPVDDLRRLCLRNLVRVRPLRPLFVSRDVRVPAQLSLHTLVAFGIALLAPSVSLVMSPILFGVPHVAADVRHLLLRRSLPRGWLFVCLAFAATLFALHLFEQSGMVGMVVQRHLHEHLGMLTIMRLQHGVGSAWILCAVAGAAKTGARRRTVVLALVLAIAVAIASLAEPRLFRVVFMHAHNVVALAIWATLFRRRSFRAAAPPLALVLLGTVLLGSGVFVRATLRFGVLSFAGLHVFAAADWLAPGLSDARALALTSTFAFLQSVHYAVWLSAIPQDDSDRKATSPFATRWRKLVADFSPLGLSIIGALVLLVGLGCARALLATRTHLLSLAAFHAWLELAAVAFFACRPPRPRGTIP